MRQTVVAAMIGIALIAPAHAAELDDAFAGVAESFMRGLVQERDVGLVFDYLREALDAAAEGREPPAADRLAQRAGEIGVEAKRRGVIAGHAVLDAIERAAREIVGGSPRPPPTSPMQRSYY
jgi:hypothetical protein